MFKFIRTINSNNTAPETFIMPLDPVMLKDVFINKDTVCCANEYGYLDNVIIPGAPKYIALENKQIDDLVQNTVKCLKITDGMIFETFCDTDLSKLHAGLRVALAPDIYGTYDHIGSEAGNDAEVVYVDPNNTQKRVFITFL